MHNALLQYSVFVYVCRQFGQFDYSQQGGYSPAPDAQYYNPQAGGAHYAGSIMTPDAPAATPFDAPSDNYDDEPPLLEGRIAGADVPCGAFLVFIHQFNVIYYHICSSDMEYFATELPDLLRDWSLL